MKNLLTIIYKNKVLLVILIIATILRFVGTKPGYPPYHSDEGISYSAATSMIKNNNLDPLRYDYPSVVPLVNYISYKYIFIPVSWTRFYVENLSRIVDGFIKLPLAGKEYQRIFQAEILGEREINALFWGRYVTAFFGVGVVFLTYLLSKNLFGVNAGRVSAFLVAVNFRQVLNSHFGLPDIYNAFFLLLSLVTSWFLLKKPTVKNYLFASVAAGFFFSTKYQTFSFLPLLFAHLVNAFKENNWKKGIRFLFNPSAIMVPLVILITVVILNPYQLIHIEETIGWFNLIFLKYRMGKMQLDFYPYSYLYHIGIGKLASVLIIIGILISLVKQRLKSIYLLLAIIPIFYTLTYYSGGGFYTRNFVTITPILLIFAGWFLVAVTKVRLQISTKIVIFVLLFIVGRESLVNSLVVVREYRSRWNIEKVAGWNNNNLPLKSTVAAHPSVPLPDGIKVIPYGLDDGQFSLEEFKELGANFIVVNLDYATAGFYGWMTESTKKSLEYWNKPLDVLEKTFTAMAIREISDYAIYSVLKPWQAPESNFVVAKVPEYKVVNSSMFKRYLFTPPQPIWNSEAIDVNGWMGYLIDYKMSGEGRGYVYLSFYKELDDVGNVGKRLAVRLSSRYNTKSLLGRIPVGSRYMVIGFDTYDSYKAVSYLDSLEVYQADVKADFSGYDIKGVKLDEGIIFPNSHGNM